MQTGLVPSKLGCAVYSSTAGANYIQGRKRALYTAQRGEGGEVADMYRKSLNVYMRKGGMYKRKEKKGDMLGEEGMMRTNTERKGYRACLQRGGTFLGCRIVCTND